MRVKENIEYILKNAKKRELGVSIVTNGYHIEEYIDSFKFTNIKEIQVTLDGVGDIHDKRRPHKNGNKTFEKIVAGIDKSLNSGFPINLRFVVDRENIDQLPALAKYSIEKEWTNNKLLKTQIGRNYELHYCQDNNNLLYSRVELYEEIYKLIKDYPEIIEFHRPAFSVSKFLFDNGELPEPLFDACPGCKSEWAFDYTGKIYSCTATVGKQGEELGTFYPDLTLNENLVEQWEDRDVTTINECKECNLQLACGGGCASVAKNQHGSIDKPDCRPIKELLEMGISYYFNKGE